MVAACSTKRARAHSARRLRLDTSVAVAHVNADDGAAMARGGRRRGEGGGEARLARRGAYTGAQVAARAEQPEGQLRGPPECAEVAKWRRE